jgi:hypothetical protein
MINTQQLKLQQLHNTYFSTGTGSEVMLILGSCRVCPILDYFDKWNTENGNRFTIVSIDPYNWAWNINNDRVNHEEIITSLETDERLLSMLKSVKYFFHEYYENFGMFNCDKGAGKNIYRFGINPEIDICLPNWNDRFVLYGDIISFDLEARKKAIADYNVLGELSEQTMQEIFEISQRNLNKFYDICDKSDIPEMKGYFQDNLKRKRLFFNFNHVSKHFTAFIFIRICRKIGIDLPNLFVQQMYLYDMFDSHYTKLTNEDVAAYGYQWVEEITTLRGRL